ncbi:piRNA biogenesis protein EXD1 [Anabrus simplex]|uniref:piRNA biogenesis protein EXD1 n=1 Tax=Anabrus simplex TaxID=316456 RepID=UPI0035A3581D
MDGEFIQGNHLLIETWRDGTVLGKYHSGDSNRLTIYDVIFNPPGKECKGLYHFYASEIKCVRELEPKLNTKDHSLMEFVPAAGPGGVQPKLLSETAKNYSKRNTSNDHDRSRNRSTNSAHYGKFEKWMEVTRNSMYVDQLEKLDGVMKILSGVSEIAMEMVAADLGFGKEVGVLIIAVEGHAYFLDVQIMGDAMFDAGLRSILESEKITKIIHNCRIISDLLFDCYNVKLNNVFDTQVANMLLAVQKYGKFPQVAPNLFEVLGYILQVPTHLMYLLKVRDGFIKSDLIKMNWINRPLSLQNCRLAVMNVVLLLPLKKAMEGKIHQDLLEYCVNFYLRVVRDAERVVSKEYPGRMFLVPRELKIMTEYKVGSLKDPQLTRLFQDGDHPASPDE